MKKTCNTWIKYQKHTYTCVFDQHKQYDFKIYDLWIFVKHWESDLSKVYFEIMYYNNSSFILYLLFIFS